MELTGQQRRMLEGGCGKGTAMAMRILTAIGEGFEAERMIPVSRAHVALSAQEADVWFAGRLLQAGAFCAVPPTVNPGYSLRCFAEKGRLTEQAEENMRETERIYRELGAILTYSCTPYLFGNIPHYGEIVSFSETSATIYVNSVLGARTNRESAASALCAAVTGFTPEYGMLLPENRLADILVEVRAPMEQSFDYSLLGLMGKELGKGVPLFEGLPERISQEALINLGTQLNVSGSFARFHITGVTPDAPDRKTAFGGREPKRRVVIGKEELEERRRELFSAPGRELSFVILGCPHYSYSQLMELGRQLSGERAVIPVWVLTSSAAEALAERTGLKAALSAAGVELLSDTCVDEACCWGHLAGQAGVTDSPKAAYYMRTFGVELSVCPQRVCIRGAKKGRI